MVNALLKGKIREKGMSQQDVASKIGVSLSRFNAKLNNTDGAQFTLREVKDMRVLLDLTPEQVDQIFLNDSILRRYYQKENNPAEAGLLSQYLGYLSWILIL